MRVQLNCRHLLRIIAGLPLVNSFFPGWAATAKPPMARVRPGDPTWPSDEKWDELGRQVGGRLIKVHSPLAACVSVPPDAACAEVFKELKNPYYLGDEVGLTQSLGWIGAWTSRPSVYAVAAELAQDVAAAVNFARTNNLRLVVKGGGHSYQGTSNAGRLLADLDAPYERGDAARRVCRRGLRRAGGAAAGRVGRRPARSGAKPTTR